MSVDLEPSELGFRRPFLREVAQSLKLRNNNPDPVAFKVKTTAPKQYCVRPNSGRIDAGQEIEVQVLLQAMKEDPPPDAKCRDKFLVQSVAVTSDREFTNVAQIWSHIEETNRSAIQEKKIRVIFLPALDGSVSNTPAKANGLSAVNGAHRSPTPEAVTPHQGGTTQVVGSAARQDTRSLNETASTAKQPISSGISSTISSAGAAVASAVPTSSEELKQQLADARNQILRLTEQVSSQGLRQRKAGAGGDAKEGPASSTTVVQQAPGGGVSVGIAAALCLFSFLLAYFFF